MHWESAEDLDSSEVIDLAILDQNGDLHTLNISLNGRFHFQRNPAPTESGGLHTEGIHQNGVYLGAFLTSKPLDPQPGSWEEWMLENWDLGYWRYWHVIVVLEGMRIDALSSWITLDNRPIALPTHPNR